MRCKRQAIYGLYEGRQNSAVIMKADVSAVKVHSAVLIEEALADANFRVRNRVIPDGRVVES